jgi:hypothetical protein
MPIVIIATLCYLLASAFFLVCVMLTARGKEYGSRVTVPSKHSDALSSSATVESSLRAEPVATVGSVAPGFQTSAACSTTPLLAVQVDRSACWYP